MSHSKKKQSTQPNEGETGRRTWSYSEASVILQYILDGLKDGFALERPSALEYYERFLKHWPPPPAITKPPGITASKVKEKVRNLFTSYRGARAWEEETGQVLKSRLGEETFMKQLLKKCPTYHLCRDIWGNKHNMKPLYTAASVQIGKPKASSKEKSSSCCSSQVEESGLGDGSDSDFTLSPTPHCSSSMSSTSSPRFLSPSTQVVKTKIARKQPKRKSTMNNDDDLYITESESEEEKVTLNRKKPGRFLDKAAYNLSTMYKKPPSQKEQYEQLCLARASNENLKITLMQKQFEREMEKDEKKEETELFQFTERMNIEKSKFNFEKERYEVQIEREREREKHEKKMKNLEIEALRLQLQLQGK